MASSSCFAHVFFFVLMHVAQAQEWPVKYTYNPDNMPIIQAKMTPPKKPLPQVASEVARLERERESFESAELLVLEDVFNKSLVHAEEKINVLVDQLMSVFDKQGDMFLSRRTNQKATRHADASRSVSFLSKKLEKPGGDNLTVRIALLPAPSPSPILQKSIQKIETARKQMEKQLFKKAKQELEGLTTIVLNEVQVQISKYVSSVLHAAKFNRAGSNLKIRQMGKEWVRSSAFLAQPVVPSGLQLATNVRILPSDEPFPTVVKMAEEMEFRRDASEDLLRSRFEELELKLLQAENHLIDVALQKWVDHIVLAV